MPGKVNSGPVKKRVREPITKLHPARGSWWSRLELELVLQAPRIFTVVVVAIALLFLIVPSKGFITPSKATPAQPTDNQNVVDNLVNQELQASSSALGAQIQFRNANELSGPKIPILYYHYIEVNPDPVHDPGRTTLAVTPTNFASQLQYLTDHGYSFLSMDQVADDLKNPKRLPPKPIVLTFDDGYEDFYLNAWPLLQQYHAKATIYVMSREGHNGACQTNIWQPNFYMSNDQILELSNSPLITVGDHTQDHCSLKGKLIGIQRQEIIDSKKELETAIGKPVTTFAYPYGAFDATSVNLVQQAGYVTAVTTIPGTVQNDSIRYLLHRLDMHNMDGAHLGQLLAKYGD